MTLPAVRRIAACVATALVTSLCLVAPPMTTSAAAAVTEATPLAVSIDSLTPSTIPARGTVTVTGSVTNRSDSPWTDLKVYLVTSGSPITTKDGLAAANATDPALEVGARITTPGLYDQVDDLEPGAHTDYRLSVPVSALQISGDPGVYWLVVHVLGTDDTGRVDGADGRARSFIPLMSANGPTTTMSLVVPVKADVQRRRNGRLIDLPTWHENLDEDGRLGRLLALSGTATGIPLTWLVDPALLDAVRSVAQDNPPFDTSPTDEAAGPSDAPSPSPSPTGDADPDEEVVEPTEESRRAAAWLASFVAQSEQHTVLHTPFAEPDLAAMLRGNFTDLLTHARDLGTATMESAGVDSEPVFAPPGGFLPGRAVDALDPDLPLILSDLAAPGAEGSLVRTGSGHEVALTSSELLRGGPAPTAPFDALAMRQRILAEAAVRALTGTQGGPLLVSTPDLWDPGAGWSLASFFTGLDVPWLGAVPPPLGSTESSGDAPYDEPLAYTRAQRRAELPVGHFLATEEFTDTGSVFANLLARNDTIDQQIARSALLASSVRARSYPHPALVRTRRASAHVRQLMERVRIDGPPFVTMSSSSGSMQVTVINGLDEPVTVGIRANTGSEDLSIEAPDPVTLGPEQRATVLLTISAEEFGVHSVTLAATTPDGRELGGTTKFNVRSSQVGLVIWVIMGVGAVVLVVAIGVRVVRRFRARDTVDSPEPADAPPSPADGAP